MAIESEHFQSSVLYWIGILEETSNQRFVQKLGGGKSAVARWRTLSIVSALDGITINELAHHTQIERTALSHLLTQMEAEELLQRRPRQDDRRVIGVHILPKGAETFRQMLPVRRSVFREAAKDVPEAQLEEMMEVIRKLVDNLQTAIADQKG